MSKQFQFKLVLLGELLTIYIRLLIPETGFPVGESAVGKSRYDAF